MDNPRGGIYEGGQNMDRHIFIWKKVLCIFFTALLVLSFSVPFTDVYADEAASEKSLLTDEELRYINDKRVLTVAVPSDFAPISYIDKTSGVYMGILSDICTYIQDETGFVFDYAPMLDHSDAMEMIKSSQADILISVIDNVDGEDSATDDFLCTDKYMTLYYDLVKGPSAVGNSTAPVIASLKNSYLRTETAALYPDAEYLYFDTITECFDAVRSGKADLLINNTYVVEEVMQNPKYNRLSVEFLDDMQNTLSIGMSADCDPLLYSIFVKTMNSLSEEERYGIIIRNTQYAGTGSLIEDIVYSDPYAVIAIISAFFGIVIIVMLGMFFQRNRFTKKEMEMLNTDNLTGCTSFQKFQRDSEALIKSAVSTKYAFSYLDFKNFKFINDVYGYDTGDNILKHLAAVLKSDMHDNELFTRINADKFVVLWTYETEDELQERFNSIKNKLLEFEPLNKERYSTVIYMGTYLLDSTSKSLNIIEMVDRAGIALKSIKNNPKNICFAVYEEALRESIFKTKSIENTMNTALSDGEFKLYIQPQHHILEDEAVMSAEALVRWETDGRVILPGEFISVLEHNGFIIELDRYMLVKVCDFLHEFLAAHPDKKMKIAVNVSRYDLYKDDFISYYCSVKDKYAIPDNLIELEFTESLAFDDKERFRDIVSQLKRKGFTCALDDFGAGSSSLNILKDLPIDVLKMDRLFFDEGESIERDNALISGVVAMAKSLGLTVVAEGIETQEQIDFLKAIGCDIIQGFIYSRPLPAKEFMRYFDWFKGS